MCSPLQDVWHEQKRFLSITRGFHFEKATVPWPTCPSLWLICRSEIVKHPHWRSLSLIVHDPTTDGIALTSRTASELDLIPAPARSSRLAFDSRRSAEIRRSVGQVSTKKALRSWNSLIFLKMRVDPEQRSTALDANIHPAKSKISKFHITSVIFSTPGSAPSGINKCAGQAPALVRMFELTLRAAE